MKTLIEKYGYIDLDSWMLNDMTLKIVNIMTDKNLEWNITYTYTNNGKRYRCSNTEGLLFYDFTEEINSSVIKSIKVIIVKITNPNKVTNKRFFCFIKNGDYGFYSSNIVDKTGYIFISYNAHMIEKDLETTVKDTLYHELRHYFDDLKSIIPKASKGTRTDNKPGHYVNVLANEILNVDEDTFENTKNKRDSETDYLLDRIIYITDPTEINAFFHSFVVVMQKYKQTHPDCTYNDIRKYMLSLKDNPICVLYFMKDVFGDEESYTKIIRGCCQKDVAAYIHYFNDMLSSVKTSNDWVLKENKFIIKKYLGNKNPYLDEISEEEARKAIKRYIVHIFTKFAYKQIYPYLKNIYKNIDKFITLLVTE